MNIITDKLPDSINIDGKDYRVHTDFKNWIKIGILFSDKRENISDAIAEILKLAYIDLPKDIKSAFYGVFKFYKGFSDEKTEEDDGVHKKSVFSYEYDAPYIQTAFKTQYNIDLQNEKMHWFKFLAYFKSLDENVMLMKIIGYRCADLAKIKDKSQKSFMRKMKRLYALPDKRTESEKEAEIIDALNILF